MENSVAYLGLKILGPGLNSHQSFGHQLKVLDNLANLANLFTFNLGKTLICDLYTRLKLNFNVKKT